MKKSNSATASSFYIDDGSTSGSFDNRETVTDASIPSLTVEQLKQHAARKSASVASAVYGHIRALRALGRTEVNTVEIADALSLPLDEVHSAITALKRKGTKGL